MLALVGGLLGVAVGSLASHVGMAVLGQRRVQTPICPYCGEAYRPVQWSAISAYLTGHGRCQTCGRAIRMPYVLGEVFLGSMWAVLLGRYGITPRVLLALVASVPQAMLLVTDTAARLVPNRIVFPSIGAALVVGSLVGPAVPFVEDHTWWQSLAGAAVAFILFRLLVWLGVALLGEGALGEGDMTLATYIGAVVGFPLVLEAVLLGIIAGAIGALGMLLLKKGGLRTAMPYGPYLILGCALTLVWGGEILMWYLG